MERNSMRRARNPDRDETANAFVRDREDFNINDYTMRLQRLLQNETLPDVFSVPIQSGPVVGRYTTTDYTPTLNEKDEAQLMLLGMLPVTDNVSLGSRVLARQGGATVVQPGVSAAYGPFQATAGYRGVIPSDGRSPTTFVPAYNFNVNTPVGEGFLAGGIDKTAGQRDPYMFASYERPFLGGTLGVDASADTRLRNLAFGLGYRRAF